MHMVFKYTNSCENTPPVHAMNGLYDVIASYIEAANTTAQTNCVVVMWDTAGQEAPCKEITSVDDPDVEHVDGALCRNDRHQICKTKLVEMPIARSRRTMLLPIAVPIVSDDYGTTNKQCSRKEQRARRKEARQRNPPQRR